MIGKIIQILINYYYVKNTAEYAIKLLRRNWIINKYGLDTYNNMKRQLLEIDFQDT